LPPLCYKKQLKLPPLCYKFSLSLPGYINTDMDFKRNAYQSLLNWKNSQYRKPLLLRGARQVGKTTLIRQFAKEFDIYIELNLEKKPEKALFDLTDDINELLSAIFLYKNVPVNDKPVLLFIDEIQESVKAIHLLRYFYEERPDIFVIAAGSLLEFALKKVPSFPVGRIEYLTLHPLNFDEFLGVVNPNAREILQQIPVPEYAQEILLKLFHNFAIVGGMPEVVSVYATSNNLSAALPIYKTLWQAYRDDVEKYAHNATERNIIRHIMETAPKESDRIKFEGFGRSNYRSREVGEALRTLDMARIIFLIYPGTDLEPPFIVNYRNRPRLQFVDTGLLTNSLLLQGEMIGLADLSDFYRGKIIQHLISQELMSIHNDPGFRPQFWVREKKGSDAEIDLVYQYGQKIIPLEIKSGEKGTLRSLHQFVNAANHPFAVRFYAGKLKIEDAKTPDGKPYQLLNLPYFLGTKITEYLQYFIDESRK